MLPFIARYWELVELHHLVPVLLWQHFHSLLHHNLLWARHLRVLLIKEGSLYLKLARAERHPTGALVIGSPCLQEPLVKRDRIRLPFPWRLLWALLTFRFLSNHRFGHNYAPLALVWVQSYLTFLHAIVDAVCRQNILFLALVERGCSARTLSLIFILLKPLIWTLIPWEKLLTLFFIEILIHFNKYLR